jgi:hypothetical protein
LGQADVQAPFGDFALLTHFYWPDLWEQLVDGQHNHGKEAGVI